MNIFPTTPNFFKIPGLPSRSITMKANHNNSDNETTLKKRNLKSGGFFVLQASGLIASHAMFFKPSLSIKPKDEFNGIDGIVMTQEQIDLIKAQKLSNVGGNKYQDYIDYFDQYSNSNGLHKKTWDALTVKDLPNEISELKKTDPVFGKAIEDSINAGKTSFYDNRADRFIKISKASATEGDFTGIDNLNNGGYNAFFIAKYSTKAVPKVPASEGKAEVPEIPAKTPTMDEAVTAHNAKYPYNKIYATKDDVTVEEAMPFIKLDVSTKLKASMSYKYDLFSTFANPMQIGMGFLLFAQWMMTLGSAFIYGNGLIEVKAKKTLPFINPPAQQNNASYQNTQDSSLLNFAMPGNSMSSQDIQQQNSLALGGCGFQQQQLGNAGTQGIMGDGQVGRFNLQQPFPHQPAPPPLPLSFLQDAPLPLSFQQPAPPPLSFQQPAPPPPPPPILQATLLPPPPPPTLPLSIQQDPPPPEDNQSTLGSLPPTLLNLQSILNPVASSGFIGQRQQGAISGAGVGMREGFPSQGLLAETWGAGARQSLGVGDLQGGQQSSTLGARGGLFSQGMGGGLASSLLGGPGGSLQAQSGQNLRGAGTVSVQDSQQNPQQGTRQRTFLRRNSSQISHPI
jgi:hypothetical protein